MFVTHSREETRLGGGGRAMMEVCVCGGGAHAGILMHTSIDLRWVRCGKLCLPGRFCCRCVYKCVSGVIVSAGI